MSTASTNGAAARGFKIDLTVLGPILALLALVLIGILLNPNFLSYANITNVLARSAFIGIIAVGMTFVITAGGLDLSVGSMAAFIAGLMILCMNLLIPGMGENLGVILIGVLVALAAGLVAGAINGLLVTRAGIEAFIVTLGTMGIYRSLVTWLADGGTLSLDYAMRELYRPVYYGGILGISWPVIVFAVVAGAAFGAGLVGKLVGFYPIESAITAGLCMANMGGTGDVAVLSAAKRMQLMPFAQISSRLGGALILLISSIVVPLFFT
ncbi:ABC transporter permease [uncultured Salinicola sp.]|uniref:ABC transporter permease n=1 Tax=uncultured Salinicola sp. TaxID=1193542 RepID=UPI002616E21D|nr:2-hydroxycarboxylate transporter family protein [uncultured Salinicola sp.]